MEQGNIRAQDMAYKINHLQVLLLDSKTHDPLVLWDASTIVFFLQ